MALTNATLPYALSIASRGWKAVAKSHVGIRAGFNVVEGTVCYKGVAEAFDMDYVPVEELVKVEP